MTDPVETKWYLDPFINDENATTSKITISDFTTRTKATCDLFGNGGLMINFQGDSPIPNRWIRFWAKVFLNSKWTLMEDNS